MDENSDPKIVNRLSKFPPFEDEEEVVDKPIEEPQEESDEVKEEMPPVVPEAEAETEVTEEVALENSKNPERTKKYIDKLKDEVQTEKRKNILESLVPTPPPVIPSAPKWPQPPITNVMPQTFPGVSQGQINETFKGLVDENGYVDTGLLIGTLKELQEKNKQAEERAVKAEETTKNAVKNFDDFQRNQIMKDVHAKFPTLDPDNENFDEKLWKYVRNEVVDQWMNGKPTDVMAAAQEGMDTLHPVDMKKADREKLEQVETAKKNINASKASQTSQRGNYGDHEALIQATRLGKKGALAERLLKSGY